MKQKFIVNKINEFIHFLSQRILQFHKASPSDDLNEYDKMKMENLMKKELKPNLKRNGSLFGQERTNNRDISAI